MELNPIFVQNACNVFLYHEGNLKRWLKELSLEDNNVFNRYLITKIDSDEFEIPVIAKAHIESIIAANMSPYTGILSADTILLPLFENSVPLKKRTFDNFIKEFFNNTDYSKRLQKIISYKGEVYYGGKGLIFDDKYNPLIMCTVKARKTQVVNEFKICYFKPIIHVNPIVFTESDKLINKGIIKKLIPCYANKEIPFSNSEYNIFYNDLASDDGKAMVVIDNFDRFFIKPIVPKIQDCTMESLNDCLVNNIDDILEII